MSYRTIKFASHTALVSGFALIALISLPALSVESTLPPVDGAVAKPSSAADSGLTDQILYKYLISEIAGQRGRSGLAFKGLTELAQKTRDPRLARRAVEVAFQAREMSAALEGTTLWLELEPNSPIARQALQALVGTQGNLDSAKANIANMLAQPGRTPAVLMQVNALLARFTEKSEVAVVVKTLSAPYMKLPEAHFAIATALHAAKDSYGAMAAVNEALQRRVNWPQAAILKSQILRESSGNKSDANSDASLDGKAAAFLAEFIAKHPDAVEARQTYARLLVSMKSYLSAREQFRIAAEQLPTDAEIPYAIGLLSQQIEDFSSAEANFKKALELEPRDPNPIYFNLGVVAEAQKTPAAAITWYQRITAGEYFVGAQLKIGHILAKRDGVAAGRKHLSDAQLAEQDAPETRIQLVLAEAQLLRDLKAHADAYELLTAAIAKDPDTADLLYDRAMVAEKINKLDSMEADLRRVIELRPEHAHAYNALGYTFAERNHRLDEAYELVQKALKFAPNDVFIQDSLGWVQFRLGQTDEALRTLKKAYQARRDPEIAAHLGEILWAKGERDEALNVWKGALIENPDNEALMAVMKRFSPK